MTYQMTCTQSTIPITRRRSLATLPLVLLLTAFHPCAHAINKCKGPDGGITFSDMPCPTTSQSETVDLQVNSGGSESRESGEGVRPALCQAQFSRGMQIKDLFGDLQVEIRGGTRYPISSTGEVFGTHILYPVSGGVVDYKVKHEGGNPTITPGCDKKEYEGSFMAFADTTFYRDKGLRRVECRLAKGQMFDPGSFASKGYSFGRDTDAMEYTFGKPPPGCSSETLYVRLKQMEVAGVKQVVMPLAKVLVR